VLIENFGKKLRHADHGLLQTLNEDNPPLAVEAETTSQV
jgi:hypothetical protein